MGTESVLKYSKILAIGQKKSRHKLRRCSGPGPAKIKARPGPARPIPTCTVGQAVVAVKCSAAAFASSVRSSVSTDDSVLLLFRVFVVVSAAASDLLIRWNG